MKKHIMAVIFLAFSLGTSAYAQTTIKNNGDIEINCAQIEGTTQQVSATLKFDGPSPSGYKWRLVPGSVVVCSSSEGSYWSVDIDETCCPSGSITLTVTIDGVTIESSRQSCATDDTTFQGWATTSPGNKMIQWSYSGACGSSNKKTWQPPSEFKTRTYYLFTLTQQGGTLSIQVQELANPPVN